MLVPRGRPRAACVLQGAVWVLRIPVPPSWGLPLLFSRWGEAGAWRGGAEPFPFGTEQGELRFQFPWRAAEPLGLL